VGKLNKVDYIIKINDRRKTYHVNMLKLFRERKSVTVNLATTTSTNGTTDSDSDELLDQISVPVNTDSGEDSVLVFSESLSDSEQKKFSVILGEYNVFSEHPGRTKLLQYEIKIDPMVKPKSQRPYKIPFHLKSDVKNELDKWLELGIIRRSESLWASPVVVVVNKDKSIRVCIDYRQLNKHIQVDPFPMPQIDNVINKLANAKFITKLDLTKAFFQIPLTDNSRKYTSFVTEFGQFEFCVVPFGIKFATAVCNRIIGGLLQEFDFVDSFVDDIIIFSNNLEDHFTHVSLVLEKLSDASLTLKSKKCIFGARSVKFLGFVVGNGTIKADPAKLEAINNFPPPAVKRDMRSFVGLINFYHRFVDKLSIICIPLLETLRKCSPDKIHWTEEVLESFHKVKDELAHSVILEIPKPGVQFIVQTDACDYGLSAVLMQEIDGVERPISFYSRRLNTAEKKYAIIEKECLAIVVGIERFRDYLYGSSFVVKTDHAPLQWLNDNKKQSSRRMRWALLLQPYDFTIKYIRGKDNFIADVLSRYPV
jgi:hypothetical protein